MRRDLGLNEVRDNDDNKIVSDKVLRYFMLINV